MLSRFPLAILRRLNRSLIYSTVESVLAKSIHVAGVQTIFDDVLHEVGPAVPVQSAMRETEASSSPGTLAKHGILDLTFSVTLASHTLPPARIGILRSLGLVEPPDLSRPDWGHHFLAEFADDADAGTVYLKVFLRTREPVPVRESLRRLRYGLPSDFWPHDFLVEDACLTNVKSIWLAKHIYL